jgi:hypothetical protein
MTETGIKITLASQEKLLAAVGRGIQTFVSVETGLAYLFASLMQPKDRGVALAVINAVWSFDTKVKMVQTAAQYRLAPGKLLTEIEKILSRCRKRTDIRNKLAHYAVGYAPGWGGPKDGQEVQSALLPPFSSHIHHSKQAYGMETPLRLNELNKFAEDCDQLFIDLMKLSNRKLGRKLYPE